MGTITNSNIFNGVAVAGNKITGMAKGGNIFYRHDGSYAPFATPILDLDFQNNFIDKSPSALTMVQGKGLPTFGLSGRKAGEYCANFNGSQSIKTTTNLPINSDKVTVAFWMKTTQTSIGLVTELSENLNISGNNGFWIILNNTSENKLEFLDRNNSVSDSNNIVRPNPNINSGVWQHIVITSDRALNGANQSKVYVNGVLDFVAVQTNDTNNNYGNHILYIGQRAGNALRYVGSLMKYQVFNQAPTDAQVMEMYQNDL